MVSGSLVMAWLCLAAGVAPVDVVYLKQRAIKIPLDIKATERPQIHQLTLFKSTDQGRTWQQEAVSSPDQDGFKFFAPSDGVYWFTVEVVDQHGRRSPEDVYKAPPSQKIVIDTLPPLVRLVKTERQGGDIVVAWEIQEDHPDLGSLRLEYRPADAPAESWYTAPLDPKLAGQTSFRLNNPAAVSVRLQLQDLAHNLGSAQAEVPGTSGVTPASLTSANAARAPVVPAVGSQSAGPSPTGGSLLPENLPMRPGTTSLN